MQISLTLQVQRGLCLNKIKETQIRFCGKIDALSLSLSLWRTQLLLAHK